MADYTGDPTTYKGPDPGAGSYGILQAQAEKAYGTALSTIQTNRSQFLTNSGVSGRYDNNGNFLGAGDPTGQTGSYWDMANANAGQGAADDAAIGASGLGGGIAAQMHEAAQKGYSQNATNWALGVGQGLDAYDAQDVAATGTAGDTLYNGLVDNITNAINAGNFNPGDFTNISIPGYGDLTSDQVQALATGLGWKPGTATTSDGTGVGPPADTTGTGTTSDPLAGHPMAANHPHYAAALKAGFTGTYNQWVAAGKPRH